MLVPCVGAKRGSERLRQCRRCLAVKFIRDLPPEMSWSGMQACPGHGRVARDRHAGLPQLMAALTKQCRIISNATLEPVFVIEFPVRLPMHAEVLSEAEVRSWACIQPQMCVTAGGAAIAGDA